MSIKRAEIYDIKTVETIVSRTVSIIYPRYYPKGAVDFFLKHHSNENIMRDIRDGYVFLCFDDIKGAVGTVTVRENEICRLFVLPEYQGNGYGRELLEFAENKIMENYDEIILDSSLSAKKI